MKKLVLLSLLGGVLLTACTLPVKSNAQEGPTFKTHGGKALTKEEYDEFTSDSNNLFLVESYSEQVDLCFVSQTFLNSTPTQPLLHPKKHRMKISQALIKKIIMSQSPSSLKLMP